MDTPVVPAEHDPDRDRWLTEGIAKKWIVAFCVNHDSGIFAAEMDQLSDDEDALDNCYTAYRLAIYPSSTLL